MRSRQRGMTMWSAAFVIATLGFFLFLFFKLLPPYMDDFKIQSAMRSLFAGSSVPATLPEAQEALGKRFEIDSINNVGVGQLKLEKRGRKNVFRMNYEVVVPLFYNVSALIEFDHAYEVAGVE